MRHARLLNHLRTFQFDGVVDGGANVGEFAYLAKSALPKAHLVCVEPHPESARYLQRKGFEVIACALWNSNTSLVLAQPDSRSTSCTVLPVEVATSCWTVQTSRLDEIPIRGRRVLVKLDLQGAELRALQGMDRMWERCAALLLEVSIGHDGSYGPIHELLSKRGYYEYSTVNELEVMGHVVEADKLWVRADLLT